MVYVKGFHTDDRAEDAVSVDKHWLSEVPNFRDWAAGA
jgi:hypothetical protein